MLALVHPERRYQSQRSLQATLPAAIMTRSSELNHPIRMMTRANSNGRLPEVPAVLPASTLEEAN